MQPTRGTYLATFAALIALSLVTLGLSFLSLGPWGRVAAIAIAMAKSVLIALFFMHLVEQRRVNALALAVSAVLVALFIGLAAGEMVTREPGVAAAPRAGAASGGAP